MISLTENPSMLERRIVTDLKISRIIGEFGEHNIDDEELPHHEEGYACQQRIQSNVKYLTEVLMSKEILLMRTIKP